MRTPYQKGRDFEYSVKRSLEARGFVVFRLAGSKPLDLIAFSPKGKVYLIECKKMNYISREQREAQMALAKRIGAEYLIITRENKYDVLSRIAPL